MGNTVGRERSLSASAPGNTRPGYTHSGSTSSRHRHGGGISGDSRPSSQTNLFSSRHERRQRDRETPEEKAERERRRQEERKRERERSMREENVDGGYLVTQGVYTGVEDFNAGIVRGLMIDRKLMPFFKGLSDFEEDWTDAQIIAAVKGEPIPGPEAEVPGPETPKDTPSASTTNLNSLTVPLASRSRSHSYTSESSAHSSGSPASGLSPSINLRLRSKTIGSHSPRGSTQGIPTKKDEVVIPGNTVDGKPIEVVLYKNAMECPICFLYYPPYFNKTRCCDQEICSECFVQIKRADPHLPEHHDDSSSQQQQDSLTGNAEQLISEPASCPFCKESDFGVVYTPPPFRLGLTRPSPPGSPSPTSQPSSPSTTPSSPLSATTRRRGTPLSSTSPQVVTTDIIRPEWAEKLRSARAHAARRAAAATALHTAAFLMGGNNGSGFTGSRRILRRPFGTGSGDASPASGSGAGTPTASSRRIVVEGSSSSGGDNGSSVVEGVALNPSTLQLLGLLPGGSNGGGDSSSGRARNRLQDLEEMMLMEAIRLSLAEEEERKRKEEEEERKKAAAGGSGAGSSTANEVGEGSSRGS